jgi:hypothetical protein
VRLTIDAEADRATLERLVKKVVADLDLILDHFDQSKAAVEQNTTADLALMAQESA